MPLKHFSTEVEQELIAHVSPAKFSSSQNSVVSHPEQAYAEQIVDALNHPIDYPPLRESVFSGDRIAIALQTGLPNPAQMLRTIWTELTQLGFAAEEINIVVSPTMAAVLGLPKEAISASVNPTHNEAPQPILHSQNGFMGRFLIHNSTNLGGVSYLTANEAGQPVYLNRHLVDADVVIPIGFSGGASLNGEDCGQDWLYPEFSTLETRNRFFSGELGLDERDQEIKLANDTLGSFFSLVVVAGPGGRVEKVLAGTRERVASEVNRISQQIWHYAGSHNSGVVLATIEKEADETTWDDLVHALLSAILISAPHAPVIVWSNLTGRPVRALREVLLSQFDEVSKEASKKLSPSLRSLLDALPGHPIYLRSQLTRDAVESLGLGYIESVAEVNRIAEPCQPGVILRDAHRYAFKPSATVIRKPSRRPKKQSR